MKFKFKNTLLVSFLAIAGILGVSSALINKQVNQEPVAEKAEATNDYGWYYNISLQGRTSKSGSWTTYSTSIHTNKTPHECYYENVACGDGFEILGFYNEGSLSGTRRYNKVIESGGASSNFNNSGTDGNITCKTAGVYSYYFKYADDSAEAGKRPTYIGYGTINVTLHYMNAATGSQIQTSSKTTTSQSAYAIPSFDPIAGYTKATVWKTSNDIDGATYSATRLTTTTFHLYAFYKPNVTVSLSAADADNAYTTSVTATYGDAMPSITTLPTRSGYSFDGYYTSGGVQYYEADGDSAKNFDSTSTITLYARWKAIRVITKYVVKDGVKEADAVGTDNVIDGNTYAVPSSPGDRSGFSFVGWYTDEACNTSYTARAITSNTDLYAKYEPNNFAAKRHYLSLDSNYGNWEKNNAWFAVYLVAPNDTSAIWIRLTKMGTSHFYYFDIPSESYNELVFVRMNPDTNTPSFDYDGGNCWNQTSDIYKDGNKDYWLMNSKQGGDHDLGASGVWYTTTDNNYRMFENQLDPTPTSMRYWFTFKSGGGTDAGQFFNSSARLGIHAYNSSTGEDHYYLMTPYQNSTTPGADHYFYYVDIPTTVNSFQLLRVSSGSTSSGRILIWNFPEGSISVSDYLPSEYWLIDFSFSSSTAVFDLTANADKPGGSYWTVSAWAMSEVLKAYYTCSDSELNGYGAAANLKSNFWDHKYMYNGDFDAATATNNPWVYDYTYADYMAHGGSYTGCTRSNSYGMNCTNKWNAISTAESRYSLGAWSSVAIFNLMGGENNFSTIIIITSSSIALLSVTALSIFVIKKRKTKEQ